METEIAALVQSAPANTVAGWYIVSTQRGYAGNNFDAALSNASVNKAFIMALAAKEFSNVWEQPPADFGKILNGQPNYQEPLALFSSAERSQIKQELAGYNWRMLTARFMANPIQSNAGYNAAANIAAFHLGGTQQASQKIHLLDPMFSTVNFVYQGAGNSGGRASAPGVATLFEKIATNSLDSLTPAQHELIRSADGVNKPWYGMHIGNYTSGSGNTYPHYQKQSDIYTGKSIAGYVDIGPDKVAYSVILNNPNTSTMETLGTLRSTILRRILAFFIP